MLINSKGEQEELSCFERDEATEAVKSCSINWQNQWYVFGGESNKRQISKLHGHKLERLGSLAFDYEFGGCSVMNNEFIFLCFNYANENDYKRCRRSSGPLETFSEVELSNHEHRATQTSCSDSKSFGFKAESYYKG